jgi:hypothetical protein
VQTGNPLVSVFVLLLQIQRKSNLILCRLSISKLRSSLRKKRFRRWQLVAAGLALGRAGLPDDIGPVVAFLCTDDAKRITGPGLEV